MSQECVDTLLLDVHSILGSPLNYVDIAVGFKLGITDKDYMAKVIKSVIDVLNMCGCNSVNYGLNSITFRTAGETDYLIVCFNGNIANPEVEGVSFYQVYRDGKYTTFVEIPVVDADNFRLRYATFDPLFEFKFAVGRDKTMNFTYDRHIKQFDDYMMQTHRFTRLRNLTPSWIKFNDKGYLDIRFSSGNKRGYTQYRLSNSYRNYDSCNYDWCKSPLCEYHTREQCIKNVNLSILNPESMHFQYMRQLLAARLFLIERSNNIDIEHVPIIFKLAGLYIPYFIDEKIYEKN